MKQIIVDFNIGLQKNKFIALKYIKYRRMTNCYLGFQQLDDFEDQNIDMTNLLTISSF